MKVGDECYCYRNTGTYDTPVWDEVDQVKDLAWPLSFGESDVSARASKFRLSEPTLIGIELTFGYQYTDAADAHFAAMLTAALGRTAIELALADGPIATVGTAYLRAGFKFFGFDNQEPLDGTKIADLSMKPCWFEDDGALVEPDYVLVEA
jgi:hypothetical protein